MISLKNIQLLSVAKSFAQALQRFPITFGLVALLTLQTLYLILWKDSIHDKNLFATTSYVLSVGVFLSMALQLWREEGAKTKWFLLVSAALYALLLGDGIYLYQPDIKLTEQIAVARMSLIVGILTTSFTLPAWKKKDDLTAWNFTFMQLRNLLLALIIGAILTLGIMLFIGSFHFLFDMNVDERFYSVNALLCMFTIPITLFLCMVPQSKQMNDNSVTTSITLQRIIYFVILPLFALYAVVLYTYGLKIIVTNTLPKGTVSWMVISLMAGVLIVLTVLYPTTKAEGNKWNKRMMHIVPAVALLPVALMTVALHRRLSDYGLTVMRIYAVVLNVWFYIICIWYALKRNARIILIPISFSALLILTSVGPFNAFRISRQSILKDVKHIIKNNGGKTYYASADEFNAFTNHIPKEEAQLLISKMNYLQGRTDSKELDDVVKGYVYTCYDAPAAEKNAGNFKTEFQYVGNNISIPSAYKHMALLDEENGITLSNQGNQIIATVTVEGQAPIKFTFPLEQLKTDNKYANAPICLTRKNKNYYLVIYKVLNWDYTEMNPDAVNACLFY